MSVIHLTIQPVIYFKQNHVIFQEMNIEEDTMAYYYILKHRMGLCLPSTCSIDDVHNVTDKRK